MAIIDGTHEELRMVALQRLKPGKAVKIYYREMQRERKWVTKKIRKGEVIGTYPFFFRVSFGNTTECFRYNELLGDEKVKVTV